MRSVLQSYESVKKDPMRPQFHFLAPSLWMNDPNGPLYINGYYHIFYQQNPYRAKWGKIHWGHARSKDLIHWEHLPIALAPSKDRREAHCFSGCAFDDNGTPTIIYTSIKNLLHVIFGGEQWIARGGKDLIHWKKEKCNPILTRKIHQHLKILHWRDPFVWKTGEQWNLILGGIHKKQRKGIILLYSSENLYNWDFQGIFFRQTRSKSEIWECPNFFTFPEKDLLILSPIGNRVIYYLGKQQGKQFYSEEPKILDYGRLFYATNLLQYSKSEIILWGWIKGGGKHWNGCLSLPMSVSLKDDALRIIPFPKLKVLREKTLFYAENVGLPQPLLITEKFILRMEAIFAFNQSRQDSIELYLEAHDESEPKDPYILLTIDFTLGILTSGKESAPIKIMGENFLQKVHLFVDKKVVEIFIDDNYRLTAFLKDLPDKEWNLFVRSNSLKTGEKENPSINILQIWGLNSIWDGDYGMNRFKDYLNV